MSALFDERVEEAIQLIWFKIHSGKREEALAKLREAANMGDGDAFYFLGRCYMGKSYVDPAVGMPEDQSFAFECFNMSLSLESAVGMFGTMHIEGYKPPGGTSVHPPYHSKREIWDAVSQKAHNGQIFCKFLLANAYYYCDVADFWDITVQNAGGDKKYKRLQYEWSATAVKLYEECVAHGLSMAIPNLLDILCSGRYGTPIQLGKANKYKHIGADMGIGSCERMLGNAYRDEGILPKAIELYERALAHNDNYTYYCLGRLYTFNGPLPLDLNKALSYLEKGYALFPDDSGFCNLLGEIYFHGGQGISCDFHRAFLLLNKAYAAGSTWGSDMLGTCYLNGLGTAPDANMARTLFALHPKRKLAIEGMKKLGKCN